MNMLNERLKQLFRGSMSETLPPSFFSSQLLTCFGCKAVFAAAIWLIVFQVWRHSRREESAPSRGPACNPRHPGTADIRESAAY